MTKIHFPQFGNREYSPFEMRQLVQALELRFQSIESSSSTDLFNRASFDTDELDNLYAPLNHTHVVADITDFPTSIFAFDDVSGSPNDGDTLVYSGGTFVTQAAGAGALDLNDLQDVNASPSDGQYLRWDATTLRWVADDLEFPPGADTLFSLDDTQLDTQLFGDLLFNADGVNWQPSGQNFQWVPDAYVQLGNSIGLNWYDTTLASRELAVLTGTVIAPVDITGTGVDFTGAASSYIQIPDATDLDIASNLYTIEFDFFLDVLPTASNTMTLIDKRNDGAQFGWGAFVSGTTGLFSFFGWASGNATPVIQLDSTTVFAANDLYRIAIVRDTGGAWSLYVDNVLEDSGTETAAIGANTSPVRMGVSNNTTDGQRPMNGKLDNIRLTQGVARYSGATITQDATPFPTSGVGDPNYSSIVFLTDCNGTVGQTSLTDQGPVGKVITFSGTASLQEYTYQIPGSTEDTFVLGDPLFPMELDATRVSLDNNIGITWADVNATNIEHLRLESVTGDANYTSVVFQSFLDGNTTDSSQYGAIATINGPTFSTTNAPPTGWSNSQVVNLSGTSDDAIEWAVPGGELAGFYDFGTAGNYNRGAAFTVEFWVYLDSLAANGDVMGTREATASLDGWALEIQSNGRLNMPIVNAAGGGAFGMPLSNPGAVTTGQWHHVAFTRNASNQCNWWVDGSNASAIANQAESRSPRDADEGFMIGSTQKTGVGTYGRSSIDGRVANVRITFGVDLYTAAFTPPTSYAESAFDNTFYVSDPGSLTQIDGSLTTVTGNFNVDGTSVLDQTLNVIGATTLDSTLDVAGEATFDTTVRLLNLNELTPSTTDHPFQIGLTSGQNLRIDRNEIMSVDNGVPDILGLQANGGQVVVGFNSSSALELHNNSYLQFEGASVNNRVTISHDNTNLNITSLNTSDINIAESGTRVHLPSTSDASVGSSTHPFQIGLDTGLNLRMDNNELFAVNNGVISALNLNADGGEVTIGNISGGDLLLRNGTDLSIYGPSNVENLLLFHSDTLGIIRSTAGAIYLQPDSANALEASSGLVRVMDRTLRVDGSTGNTEYADFTHNDTDFITNFVLTGDWDITGLTGEMFVDADFRVSGDLTVGGTTTTINSNIVSIADNIILLNSDEAGVPTENAGLEIERGTSANVFLRWNETSDRWEFTNDGSTYQSLINAGTTTNATLAWSGSDWIENTAVRHASDHLDIRSGAPTIWFYETDAAAGNQNWYLGALSETFTGRAYNDTFTGSTEWLRVDRTGTTIDQIQLNATTLDFNGNADVSGALTATSYGGILEANLVDKTASEDISGQWNFDTDTGANPLLISRLGGTTETLRIWVNDNQAVFNHVQDETDGTPHLFIFNYTNAGAGNPTGSHYLEMQYESSSRHRFYTDSPRSGYYMFGGDLRVYDDTSADFIQLSHNGTRGDIETAGVGGGDLYFTAQGTAVAAALTNGNWTMLGDALLTNNNRFLYGRDTGAAVQTVIGLDNSDTVMIGDTALYNRWRDPAGTYFLRESSYNFEGVMYYEHVSGSVTDNLWYTVAKQPSSMVLTSAPPADTSGLGGERAEGHFIITDQTSGQHGFCEFKVSCHYGRRPTITLLNKTGYGTDSNPVRAIRVVHAPGTYQGQAIQVLAGQTGTLRIKGRTEQNTGKFILQAPVNETPDAGWQITGLPMQDFSGNVFFALAGDNSTAGTGDSAARFVVTPDRTYPTGEPLGYFQRLSGDFGSVQVEGAAGSSGSWSGYSIGGEAVFMSLNTGVATTNRFGLYDDLSNFWALQYNGDASSRELWLYHAGVRVADTRSAATGGLFVNNQATGAGFERVLTTADLGGGGVTDHGALTGLGDDDHPQYGAIASAETISGIWDYTTQSQHRFGIGGDYSSTSGDGTWGATIWSLDTTWQGGTAGPNSSSGGVYGLRWLRSTHSSAVSQVGEGLYIYQAGAFQFGAGSGGALTRNVVPITDSTYTLGSASLSWDLLYADQIDFPDEVGEKEAYFGAFGSASSYGVGIESNTLYWKSSNTYRWYIGANADGGTSDVMQLTASQLTLNADLILPDNFEVNFGTAAGDPSIYFNGTNLILDGMASTVNWAFIDGGLTRALWDLPTSLNIYDGAQYRAYNPADTNYAFLQQDATSGRIGSTSGGLTLEDYNIESTDATPTGTTQTITYSTSNVYSVDLESATGNVTITISGGPASGTFGEMTVRVIQDSTTVRTVTWAGGTFEWAGGSAHPLTTTLNGFSVFHFMSWDGGTTWFASGADFS